VIIVPHFAWAAPDVIGDSADCTRRIGRGVPIRIKHNARAAGIPSLALPGHVLRVAVLGGNPARAPFYCHQPIHMDFGCMAHFDHA
jgi:hypothetical protein